ncbi:MAG: glycosyltransferase family 39 protein [Flavobacteriales bacterium]|nr:glycosyltransferase family 39 protein [Flavobacteriales bacterium]
MVNNKRVNFGLGLTLSIIVLFATWLVLNQPIHIDEALTYRHFVSQGWRIAISTYPFPNNHVLFSVLGSFVVEIPMNPFTAMRSVSLISAIVSGFLIYRILRVESSVTWSLIGVLFWSCSMATIQYSAQARGYGLQATFFLVALYGSIKILSEEKAKSEFSSWAYWSLLAISVSLGVFTLPSFIIPAFSLGSMLVWELYQKEGTVPVVKILVSAILSIVFAFALYSPLMYYSGIDSIIGNQWVNERNLHNLADGEKLNFLYDIFTLLGPAFVLGLILTVLPNRNLFGLQKRFLWFFLGSAAAYVIVFRTLPFPRTFSYLSAVISISLVWNMKGLSIGKSMNKALAGSYAAIILSLIFAMVKILPEKDNPSIIAKELSQNEMVVKMDTIYTDGWNNCGAMLDFYSWYHGEGPIVQPLYSQNFWSEFQIRNGSQFLTERKSEISDCVLVAEYQQTGVFDCR